MSSKRRTASKCRTLSIAILFLASVAALITIVVIQGKWKTEQYTTEYGIVIDSGSSRSNVYLYQWPGEKENETGVVSELLNLRVEGIPISDMKVDPKKDEACWKGFKKSMDMIKTLIPVEKHKRTPIFLGATAGMRLLHKTNEQRSNEILKSLNEYMKSLPFMFQNVSIITGQEEGLYGWITVNYLMGNFVEKNLWNTFMRPNGGRTVGSMDLGGASTQIAFALDEEARGPNYVQVKLYGYHYNIYSHSYLCYGKNEVEKRILEKVVQESSNLTYVNNPCYAEGFNMTINASFIYDTACTGMPVNYNPNQQIFMVGDPSSEKCRAIVRSLFDFQSTAGKHSSFDGVEQPPVTGDFMAYAGFFYTARALLLNVSSELDVFNATTREFCHTHWTVLQVERPLISKRFLKTYCYSAHYVFTLLTEGYKFDEESWKNIKFQKEVKDTSIGWSLGYMLSMSNMIPSEAKEILPMSNPLFAGLIFLFSALAIVTFVFLFIILIRTCY